MKAFTILAAAVAFAGIPLWAQQASGDASASAQSTTANAPAAPGFGDEAAAHAREMTAVSCELQGHLDSKSAKVGDRVILKTTGKTQTSDGTAIPKGSRLVGHVTEVQAHSRDHAMAQIGIAFDHVELKSGGSIPVHTLIRVIRPAVSIPAMNAMDNNGMNPGGMGAPGGPMGSTEANATDPGGKAVSGVAGGTINRSGEVTSSDTMRTTGPDRTAGASGGVGPSTGKGGGLSPTGIPGIVLARSSTASGLFVDADRRDVELYDGTQFELGLVVDK